MVGTIEQVGVVCSQFAAGDRVAMRTGHRSLAVVPDTPFVRAVEVPDGVPFQMPGRNCLSREVLVASEVAPKSSRKTS